MLTSVILISIVSLFNSAMLQDRLAKETTDATVLASQQVERLLSLPSSSTELQTGLTIEDLPGTYLRWTYIADDHPVQGVKFIKVTVNRATSDREVVLVGLRPQD